MIKATATTKKPYIPETTHRIQECHIEGQRA
jgi:hypothetical protein